MRCLRRKRYAIFYSNKNNIKDNKLISVGDYSIFYSPSHWKLLPPNALSFLLKSSVWGVREDFVGNRVLCNFQNKNAPPWFSTLFESVFVFFLNTLYIPCISCERCMRSLWCKSVVWSSVPADMSYSDAVGRARNRFGVVGATSGKTFVLLSRPYNALSFSWGKKKNTLLRSRPCNEVCGKNSSKYLLEIRDILSQSS